MIKITEKKNFNYFCVYNNNYSAMCKGFYFPLCLSCDNFFKKILKLLQMEIK